MAAGFDVSALTTYIDQTKTDLIAALTFSGVIAQEAVPQLGVKGIQALQILSVAPTPAAGTSCGFTATGGVTFTQRNITGTSLKWEDGFCLKDLEPYWTQLLLKAGANYTEADMPAMIVDEIMKKITEWLAVIDWRGNTSSVDAWLGRYNGLLSVITGASGLVTVSGSASLTNTLANARSIAQNAVLAVPNVYIGSPDFKFYCDPVYFRLYLQKIANDNLFNKYDDDAMKKGRVLLENSPHELVMDKGLTGTGILVGIDAGRNAYLAMDGKGDEDNVDLWYERKDEKVNYRIRHRRGWQISIPSEVAYFIAG